MAIDDAEIERLLLLVLEPVELLPHVAEHADDIEALLPLQPLDADRGIQATRICEYNLFLAHDGCVLPWYVECDADEPDEVLPVSP